MINRVRLTAVWLLTGGLCLAAGCDRFGGGGPIAATLGRLYALETLGSACGGLVTGFVLLGLAAFHFGGEAPGRMLSHAPEDPLRPPGPLSEPPEPAAEPSRAGSPTPPAALRPARWSSPG